MYVAKSLRQQFKNWASRRSWPARVSQHWNCSASTRIDPRRGTSTSHAGPSGDQRFEIGLAAPNLPAVLVSDHRSPVDRIIRGAAERFVRSRSVRGTDRCDPPGARPDELSPAYPRRGRTCDQRIDFVSRGIRPWGRGRAQPRSPGIRGGNEHAGQPNVLEAATPIARRRPSVGVGQSHEGAVNGTSAIWLAISAPTASRRG